MFLAYKHKLGLLHRVSCSSPVLGYFFLASGSSQWLWQEAQLPLQPSPFQPPCLEIQTTASANSTAKYYQRDDPAKCHIHPSISLMQLSAPKYTRFAGKEQQPAAHFLCRAQPVRLPGGNVARPAVGAPFLQPEKVFREK